jgi:hypothetical protein
MPARKPPPPPEADNPEQYRRFIDMARKVEADETPGALDRVFEQIFVRQARSGRKSDARQSPKKS